MKLVLVVYYSQTGQLERIVRSVMAPFERSPEVQIDYQVLRPARAYPFPWPLIRFFDQFPESVRLDPPELQPLSIDAAADYDLVVLGYQPWYLSPSPPTTAFLKSPAAAVLRGKPVVTVIGCRNMWIMGQEAVRKLVAAAGGRLAGNIVLADQGSPYETFITTPVWLLTGRKQFLPGVFTPAGVAEAQIEGARVYGEQLLGGLLAGRLAAGEAVLDPGRASPVNPSYVVSEKLGWRSFWVWSWIVRLAGKQGSPLRLPLLGLYALFLVAAIALVVPLTLVARQLLMLVPAYRRWLQQQVDYHERTPLAAGR